MAPRPHNSGHWTMDACRIGQFEMHVRAVVVLPLPQPGREHDAVMRNLVGPDSYAAWPRLAAEPGVALHLYGKVQGTEGARPGRKLGHATRLLPLGRLAEEADAAALAPL